MKKLLLSLAALAMSTMSFATVKATYEPATPKAFGNWGAEITIPQSLFATAKAGDTVKMTFSDCGENPQVQIVTKIGAEWTWTELVEYGAITADTYEYVLPESFESTDIIPVLAERGMILKGQNATLTKAELIGDEGQGGGDDPVNPNPGGNTGDATVVDTFVPETPVPFGNWGKEVTIDKTLFYKAKVGDIVRMTFTDCGADPQVQIVAKIGTGWDWTELVKYGDIEANVYEYAIPADFNGEEVLTWLKQRGMILKGQNATLAKAELLSNGTDTPDNTKEIGSWAPAEPVDLNGWNKEVLIPGSTFAKANLGDLVKLSFTECGATPQVQVAVKLGELWTWTELVKSGDIVADVYEYTIAELAAKKATRADNDVDTVLGALKEHGMILKGQQAKLAKVSVVTTSDTSAVEGVEIEDAEAPVEIYNLQGVRVNEMTKGIYILRQGNKVTKVIK